MFDEGLASSRSERLVSWSRLVELSRRADCAWCTAVDWGDTRGWGWARQVGQHVAPVRGGSADYKQRGKATAPARPDAIL